MSTEGGRKKKFGMFSGVFVPTFLTIMGVIFFLRVGYVVGVGGILGSIIIILLSVSVTLATGLSLSSITTNIKIGAGGAYSIISKTLGLEIGGSVGVPLFLAQVFSVALYIFGFTEAWLFIFPSHPFMLVALATFGVIFALVFISTKLAVRAQIIVFIAVCAAVVSVFLGGDLLSIGMGTPQTPLFGEFGEMDFWSLFALFFPAVTGLMAGVGMSGDLTDPKGQIPKGVISALGITAFLYILAALWFGYSASPVELIENPLLIVKLSFFGPVVLIGILAATFSSALTTLIAAPRVMQALSQNRILPFSDVMTELTDKGEPRNATLFTGGIVAILLLVGSLDSIAQVLTIFFLITYMMINVSVFIENFLSLPSFRPTFDVPKVVPLFGAVSSFVIIFLINIPAGIGAIFFVFVMYLFLVNRKLTQEAGDVRSGLFREISEWAIKKIRNLPESEEHIWKPNLLIPVLTTRTLAGNFPLIKSIAYPHGTMTTLGVRLTKDIQDNPETEEITEGKMKKELRQLPKIVKRFGEEGIFTHYSTINTRDYVEGVLTSLGAMSSQVFSPNILFLPFKPDKISKENLEKITQTSKELEKGVMIFDRDEELGLGSEKNIHLWISPETLEKEFEADRNFDLAGLVAHEMRENWGGIINFHMCVAEGKEKKAWVYLRRLIYEARIPQDKSRVQIKKGDFINCLDDAEDGDLHIIPFDDTNIDTIFDIIEVENKSYLFVSDSGLENLLS